MSGPIEVGQTWQRLDGGGQVRVTSVDADGVLFRGPGGSGASSVAGFLRWYQHKPTIPLRIRVGVTADGEYLAGGTNDTVTPLTDEQLSQSIAEAISRPVVAWHWITAEIPMPETEQGETKGEVEP